MRLALDASSRRVRLVALLVGISLIVVAVLQISSQRQARRDAEVAAARLAFQQELTLAYDGLTEPTRDASVALSELREVLQQHLALTGLTAQDVADARVALTADLVTTADRLAAAAAGSLPDPPTPLEPDAPAALRQQLDGLRVEARGLADDLREVADRVRTWATALAALREASVAFVQLAESHPSTTDPTELAAQWTAERDALGAYREQAGAAASVPGLRPVAEAHVAYADANVAWIDEAVALLEAGDLDAYNARLREVFAVDDPFGFRASLQSAIEQAFDLGVLAELAASRERATALLDRVAEARRLTPILLRPSDADTEPTEPTPAPTG